MLVSDRGPTTVLSVLWWVIDVLDAIVLVSGEHSIMKWLLGAVCA